MSEPPVPVFRVPWLAVAAWLAFGALLGLAAGGTMRLLELQGRVGDLERRVARLEASR